MTPSSKALKRSNHLFSETTAAYHEASLRLGLSDSVMQILYTICDSGGGQRCSIQEICRQTGLLKQTVNSALRRMEGEGFVYLEATGKKGKDVCLTEAGIRLAERTAARLIQAENAIFASWPEEDVETYLSLSEKYLTAFRAEIENLL